MTARPPLWLAVAVAAAAGVSCERSTPTTGVVVEVTSDLRVPADLDQVRVTATGSDGRDLFEQTFSLTGGSARALPLRVGLFRQGSGSAPFRVAAEGLAGDTVVARQSAKLGFIEGRVVLLELALQAACSGRTCQAEETCVAGACRPDTVDPTGLPDYTPIDGGGVIDGGGDVTEGGGDATDGVAATDAGGDGSGGRDGATDGAGAADGGAADRADAGDGGGGAGGTDVRPGTDGPLIPDASNDGPPPPDAVTDAGTVDSAIDRPDADGSTDRPDSGSDVGLDAGLLDAASDGGVNLNAGLVGYWAFDQAGMTYPDYSGQNNTARISNTRWITGPHGGALDFTPAYSGGWVMESPSLAAITRTVTLATWIRPVAPLGSPHMILTRYVSAGSGELALDLSEQGMLRFLIGSRVMQAPAAIGSSNQWIHIAGTYDGNVGTIYIGGQVAASNVLGMISLDGSDGFTFGYRWDSTMGLYYDVLLCEIDEVTIYDRALNAQEVARLAAGQFPTRILQ
jgi:hypothetical protein